MNAELIFIKDWKFLYQKQKLALPKIDLVVCDFALILFKCFMQDLWLIVQC